MSKNVSTEEMWRTIERHGFSRKMIESTEPDRELVVKVYRALKAIQEKESELIAVSA